MLANKVALITGAAQGIGLAATKLLLKNGARVSMVDMAEEVGKRVCAELQKEFSPNDVMFIRTDVTQSEQLKAAFKDTKEKFGGIDIVINNAGIVDEQLWRKMVQVNLISVIEGTKLAVEHMSLQNGGKGGTVVNMASLAGLVPLPFIPSYCATKHGVVGFTRSLKGLVSSDGVRVNCVCPNPVDTKMASDMAKLSPEVESAMMDLGLISPDTVAEGILKLITDESLVGAAMTITVKDGIDFWVFPDEEKTSGH